CRPSQSLTTRGCLPVHREYFHQLRAAIAATRFAINPHAIAQGEATHDFRRHKNILRGLNKIAFGVTEKTKAFAGDLDDTFAKFGLALDLFARFGRAFQCFGSNRVAACRARRIIPRLIVGLVRIIVSAAIVVPPAAIAAAPTRAALLRRSSRSGSFQRWLFFVFFVHKLKRPIARRGKRTAKFSERKFLYQAGNLASISSGISRFE